MRDNLSRAGLTLLIIFTTLLLVAYVKNLAEKEPTVVYIQDPNYVQNIGEAQRRLKAQGLYHGPIDYKWGQGTEQGYRDYCAIEAVEGE